MKDKDLLTENLEDYQFWNPNYILEIDWEEYDKAWESKWKWEIN